MTIETKGKSKISAAEVIKARKLKVANPEMSMEAIKAKLGLKLSAIMVGRAIRGITHQHIDMCGLPVRPFNTGDAKPAKKAAKKATAKKAAKPAAKKATKKAAKKEAPKKAAKPVKTPEVDGKTLAAGGE
jgi:hypothetical protein